MKLHKNWMGKCVCAPLRQVAMVWKLHKLPTPCYNIMQYKSNGVVWKSTIKEKNPICCNWMKTVYFVERKKKIDNICICLGFDPFLASC